jgi:hypothetical protein
MHFPSSRCCVQLVYEQNGRGRLIRPKPIIKANSHAHIINPVNFQIPKEPAIISTGVRHCPLRHAIVSIGTEYVVSMALSTSEAQGFEHLHSSKGYTNRFHSSRDSHSRLAALDEAPLAEVLIAILDKSRHFEIIRSASLDRCVASAFPIH